MTFDRWHVTCSDASEGLPQRNVQDAAALEASRRQLAAIELEAEIDANRADRRLVADAEAGGGAQLAEVEIARARKHVAGVEEPDSAEAADERRRAARR